MKKLAQSYLNQAKRFEKLARSYLNQAKRFEKLAQSYLNQAKRFEKLAQSYLNQAKRFEKLARSYFNEAKRLKKVARSYLNQAKSQEKQTMILIDNVLVSDAVVQEQFICNLTACKGACCIEGEGGAPLTDEELDILEDIYDEVAPFMTESGRETIAEKGCFVPTDSSKFTQFATPLIGDGQACAYVTFDENLVTQCAIQLAYKAGKIDFPKPISCHLYPIRITENEGSFDAVNYDEWDICKAACTLGKKEGVKVYEFLKEPLIRKYGVEFYERLDGAAKQNQP